MKKDTRTIYLIYIDYLRMYYETGARPRIDEMLLLKLLEKIEVFTKRNLTAKEFYTYYKEIIEDTLIQIHHDFKIPNKDILDLKQDKGINVLDSDSDYLLYQDIIEIINKYINKYKIIITKEKIYYKYYENIYNKKNLKVKKKQVK